MQTTLLPAAGVYLKDFYDTTVEFISLRSPTFLVKSSPTDRADNSPASAMSNTIRDCSACPYHCSLSLCPMRREMEVLKAELSCSRTQLSTLEESCKLLENSLRDAQEALRLKEVQVAQLTGSQTKPNRRRSDASQKRRSHLSAKSSAENGLASSPDQRYLIERTINGDHDREEEMSITQEQSAHTKSLEIFLTKTDMWSGAQIIQAVHDLNSEILQFAASASELCTFDRCVQTAHPQSLQEITTRLGPQLSRILSTRDHSQDPILVQFALQGCISTLVAIALSSFCIGLQGKFNVILSTIYSQIASSEPQPTSARWRALTHRHIHNIQPNLSEREVNEVTETILRLSSDIFLLSGCSATTSTPSLCDGLRTHFGERVRRIARSVCKLAQVTKEEILSTNFEIVAVDHSEPFDVKNMQDAFGEYGPSHGNVLCTTELGLRCMTRISGELGNQGAVEKRFLLRPKVLLESVLDALDPR